MIVKKPFLFAVFLIFVSSFFLWNFFAGSQVLEVSEVIDGDTIRLANGMRVRYIGVDAPETGECYAQELSKSIRS